MKEADVQEEAEHAARIGHQVGLGGLHGLADLGELLVLVVEVDAQEVGGRPVAYVEAPLLHRVRLLRAAQRAQLRAVGAVVELGAVEGLLEAQVALVGELREAGVIAVGSPVSRGVKFAPSSQLDTKNAGNCILYTIHNK